MEYNLAFLVLVWGRGGLILSGRWRVAGLAGQILQAENTLLLRRFVPYIGNINAMYERKKHA